MKKALSAAIILLFILTIIFPIGATTAYCLGFSLQLVRALPFAIIVALLSVCGVILAFVAKSAHGDKQLQALALVITPLSMLNLLFCIFASKDIVTATLLLLSAICCCCLTIKLGRSLLLKIASLLLSAGMLVIIVFCGFFVFVLGDIGVSTAIRTAESPSGKYYAQVIDVDQGGLGGSTVVRVYTKGELDLIFFKVSKKPLNVYSGRYGEAFDMHLSWENDSCLLINSAVYQIK